MTKREIKLSLKLEIKHSVIKVVASGCSDYAFCVCSGTYAIEPYLEVKTVNFYRIYTYVYKCLLSFYAHLLV